MEGSDEIEKVEVLPALLSDGAKELQDEVSNELFQSIAEGIIPKVKLFIPKAIKAIDEDEELIINQNEMIIITREEESGSIVVVKGTKDVLELHGDISKCEINDLASIFEMLLDLMAKEKASK